jgi:hypothetical protein
MKDDNFERKRDAALDILAKSGVSKGMYRPHYIRWLWHMGINVPPLPFASLLTIAVYNASVFCVIFGLLTYVLTSLIFPTDPQETAVRVLIECAIAGTIYTLLMTLYYAHLRRKYKLPKWSDL